MILSVQHIDKACREGFFVYVGNRQKISGCQSEISKEGKAESGKAWVCMAGEWKQVLLTNIVIENRKGESEMPLQGKGRPGAVTHISRKASSKRQVAKANNGNRELQGMDTDNRRIAAIEDAEEARQSASQEISVAQKNYEEAEQAVIAAMHENGFDLKKRPVYTRAPWGSVSLQQSGEVKEKVKFTAIKKGAKKKKDEKE